MLVWKLPRNLKKGLDMFQTSDGPSTLSVLVWKLPARLQKIQERRGVVPKVWALRSQPMSMSVPAQLVPILGAKSN